MKNISNKIYDALSYYRTFKNVRLEIHQFTNIHNIVTPLQITIDFKTRKNMIVYSTGNIDTSSIAHSTYITIQIFGKFNGILRNIIKNNE